MKRTKLSFLLSIFMMLTILSCSPSVSYEKEIQSMNVLNPESALKVSLLDIVDSISYIPLNTDVCLLSHIEKVQRDSCFYFVKDANGLYVFDADGMFVNEIGHKGQGPREYLYINAFYLDKDKKNVCIISLPDKKFLTFSYEGEFVSASKLEKEDAFVSSVYPMKGDKLLVHRPLPNDINENNYEYVMLELRDVSYVVSPLMENLGIKSGNAHYSFLRYPMTSWNGKYYTLSTLSNIIYRYVDNSLIPELRLDLPNISPSTGYIERYSEMDFFSLLERLDEDRIGKGILGMVSQNDKLFLSINNGLTVVYDGMSAILIDALVHCPNINGYLFSLFTGGLCDEMIGHYEPEVLLSKKEYINLGNDIRLKQIVDNLQEEDNPILYQYHLKSDLMEQLKNKLGRDEKFD